MLRRSIMSLAMVAMMSHLALAQQKGPDLACIDKAGNKNGKIDIEEEVVVLARHSEDVAFREMDTNCDGRISLDEFKTWDQDKRQSTRIRLAIRDLERQVKAGAGPQIDPPKSDPKKKSTEEESVWTQPAGSGRFYLRRDFQDFHTFSSPTPTGNGPAGNGADFGITWDQEARNRAVSAKGVAFMPFIFDHRWEESNRHSPYIGSIAVAPSVRFEYLNNSNLALKKKNIEIVTPGVTAEAEIGNLLALSHFVRMRASVVTNMGHADSWQLRGEWQPIEPSGTICLGTPCTLIGSPILFRFDPVLIAEYAGATSGVDLTSDPLFQDRNRALRVGPSLALKMYPNGLRRDELPVFLQHAEFKAGYNWYSELYSGRRYSLLDLAMTFRANKDDTLGFTLSYSAPRLLNATSIF